MVERTLETRASSAVRLAVVLVFGLVALAGELGLDLLLGGFVAGMITRLALRDREVTVFESKLTAVGYGLLIPFFFITSGMAFDLDALRPRLGAAGRCSVPGALPRGPRGTRLILYRSEMSLGTGVALASLLATELPLVVAITTLAVEAGHMHSSTAAGLVGAAILSSLIYPLGRAEAAARRARGP